MAVTLTCINGEQDLDCCTGQTAAISFKGLLLSDSVAGTEKVIYSPYLFAEDAASVHIWDQRGNSDEITVADTSFSTVAEIVDFLTGCQAKRGHHILVENFTGNTYTVPWTLATTERARRIQIFLGGIKQTFGVNVSASGNQLTFDFPGGGEPLEIYQDVF